MWECVPVCVHACVCASACVPVYVCLCVCVYTKMMYYYCVCMYVCVNDVACLCTGDDAKDSLIVIKMYCRLVKEIVIKMYCRLVKEVNHVHLFGRLCMSVC